MPAGRGRRGGRLHDQTLTPQYRRHLREAGAWILGKAAELGSSLNSRSSSRWVDQALERVVEWSHGHGEKLYWITLGVLSVQRQYRLSAPLLRSTWAAIKSWRLLQPVQPRVPITFYVLRCFLVACLGRVNRTSSPLRVEWMSTLLAAWLAFEGMLRPGEVERLIIKDFCFPEDVELSEGIGLVLNIRQAKTRRVWASQFVIIRSQVLVSWLKWWCEGQRPNSFFLQVSRRKWAVLFKEVMESLQLEKCGLTLGSLRGGGACHRFRVEQNLGTLQFAGRWRRPETLRHYLQEALAIHTLAHAPAASRELLSLCFAHVHLLEQPPRRSRQVLLS